MRPSNPVTVSSILFLVMILLGTGCTGLRNLEPPEVVLTAIRPLDSSTLFEQRFEVGLRLYNPNNRDLDIDGINFELDVNGQRLARAAGANDFLLPRLGEAETTVVVSTSLISVARQLMTLQQSETLSYRLNGRVHLGSAFGISLPFEKSGQLSSETIL